ncbi:hypothetical protein PspLS_11765, partial [Pyricularia sp. CBS 133598]
NGYSATAYPNPFTSVPVISTTLVVLPSPSRPDIAYRPNWKKYQARVACRWTIGDLPKIIFVDLPKELEGDSGWEAQTLDQEYDWTTGTRPSLSAIFTTRWLTSNKISQETFPFPISTASCTASHESFTSATAFLSFVEWTQTGTIARKVSHYFTRACYRISAPSVGVKTSIWMASTPTSWSVTSRTSYRDFQMTTTAPKPGFTCRLYTSDRQTFHTNSGDIVSLSALSTATEGVNLTNSINSILLSVLLLFPPWIKNPTKHTAHSAITKTVDGID